MPITNVSEIYNLLEIKRKLLSKILVVTKSQNFQPLAEDNNVERISSYSRNRTALFERLNKVQKKIEFISDDEYLQFKQNHKEVEELELECKKIIKEIIYLDNKNTIIFNKVYSTIRSNIKTIQNTKLISSGYKVNNYQGNISSYFDSSK